MNVTSDLSRAYDIISPVVSSITGRYYVRPPSADPGAGLIYHNLRYPTFRKDQGLFATVRGLCVVLTHECDVEPTNNKVYNDSFLICPIIPFELFVSEVAGVLPPTNFEAYFANLAHRRIYQLLYIPVYPGVLPMGGVLHLNRISHTNVSVLELGEAAAVCCLSRDGLRQLDYALTTSLLRPKEDWIPRLN